MNNVRELAEGTRRSASRRSSFPSVSAHWYPENGRRKPREKETIEQPDEVSYAKQSLRVSRPAVIMRDCAVWDARDEELLKRIIYRRVGATRNRVLYGAWNSIRKRKPLTEANCDPITTVLQVTKRSGLANWFCLGNSVSGNDCSQSFHRWNTERWHTYACKYGKPGELTVHQISRLLPVAPTTWTTTGSRFTRVKRLRQGY